MTTLTQKFSSIIKVNISRYISSTSITYGHWIRDYVAESVPKTLEERYAAAKKYNLHPKEYKLHSEDEYYGIGDYPKLPFKGVAVRDPYYPYDLPEYKRNFNEPVHFDIDMLGEDRCDIGLKERYSKKAIIFSTLLIFGCLFGSSYVSLYVPMFQPVAEKQYPWIGKAYYTFEELK
ncbi:NADH dehydrogenase [ubiquinone] 1 beta subcomplex subunit 8, mitochondrial [Copidosoma floridanum]|uniref:NADH dehydrogenase [ubiquinone] 1 beta subcomplex subunit 8, mitochondrial n=1 Tax=Copidosoma floridanum TaxID=29053 RepID=UPI0006C9730F|nr:NADH dehydrogenase [ubiquinone] 1 beta subcomplex subunit 8, mitochondrial [Copidosoma floridanum]